jgi:glutathione peroxidase
MNNAFYGIAAKRIDGKAETMADHKGKVLLVVNVASKCGLTPQYEGLEKLYEKYKDRGFEVLGFPANEFGAQEPGTNAEITAFCTTNYGVKFPMFEKIAVKGKDQHPLYKHMIAAKPRAQMKKDSPLLAKLKEFKMGPENDEVIAWNFEKFLVNRSGDVVARFAPDFTPDDPAITGAIEQELAKTA